MQQASIWDHKRHQLLIEPIWMQELFFNLIGLSSFLLRYGALEKIDLASSGMISGLVRVALVKKLLKLSYAS